jgi:hypothetical protein
MGRENANLAYARWAHLSHVPFRLLVYMALRSIDDDNPPQFWGGREELAHALGRVVPPEPAKNDSSARAQQFRKQRAADFEAVKVALRPLAAVSVIVLSRRAGGGLPACYDLHLGIGQGKAGPTPEGRLSLPLRKAQPTPGGRPDLPLDGGVGGETLQQTVDQHTSTNINYSPKVSSSLANPAEISETQMTYDIAAGILGKLPDLGQAYLARIAEIEGMRNRVIAAATLAITENPTLAPREAS